MGVFTAGAGVVATVSVSAGSRARDVVSSSHRGPLINKSAFSAVSHFLFTIILSSVRSFLWQQDASSACAGGVPLLMACSAELRNSSLASAPRDEL